MIIITGGTGWLGQRLIRHIRQQDQGVLLRVLKLPHEPIPQWDDSGDSTTPHHGIEWINGDLTNPSSLTPLFLNTKGWIFIHCAGVIHPKRVSTFYQVNRDGTQHVLDMATQAGIQRAIVMSSNSPCGYNPNPDHCFDESAPYQPYQHYGRSKMMMEDVVRSVAAQSTLETVVIRAPWFYGPGQPIRQLTFFTMIQKGRAPLLGKGNNKRSMVYVDELAMGIWLAAQSPKAVGQTYWIADETPYRMSEIIDTIETLLETTFDRTVAHRRLNLPIWVGDVAMACDTLIQWAGCYHQKIHVLSEMHQTIACSTQKAQRELGFCSTVGLQEGMRRSIQWAIEHQHF